MSPQNVFRGNGFGNGVNSTGKNAVRNLYKSPARELQILIRIQHNLRSSVMSEEI